MRKKIKVRFIIFIIDLFTFLTSTCFVWNSMGNGTVEGAITSILKH